MCSIDQERSAQRDLSDTDSKLARRLGARPNISLAPGQEISSRQLYRAFRDVEENVTDLYDVYQQLYQGIPRKSYTHRLSDINAFKYCLARKFFIVLVPYTHYQHVLVQRVFQDDELTWAFIGGGIRRDKPETFIDAVTRHGRYSMEGIQLSEVEPVAFIENHFEFKERHHVHFGIAFVARIRNSNAPTILHESAYSRGHFVPIDAKSAIYNLSQHADLVPIVADYLDNHSISPQFASEIEENERFVQRYRFHARFVKPLFHLLGKPLFPASIADYDREILDMVTAETNETILDMSCGDNEFVLRVVKQEGVRLVVGNDISWSQIELMSERISGDYLRNASSLLLFTNHDACKLPFADKSFDLVFCKNTLHHMDSLSTVRKLLSECVRIGKRAIIVEILDPQVEGWWGSLKHAYFMNFLHDAGNNFLGREEFARLTDAAGQCSRREIHLSKGIYQIAIFGNTNAQ